MAVILAMALGCREKTTEPKMVATPVLDLSGGSCKILSYRYENTQDWAQQGAGALWQGG